VSALGELDSALLEAMPDAIIVVDPEGSIVQANAQCQALFGYPRASLLGQPVELLMPERYRSGHLGHQGRFLAAGQPRGMGSGRELLGRRSDGSEFPVEISLNPVVAGTQRLVVAAVRDTSERHAAQRMLSDKNQQLEAALLARDSFLASMSHELRTPLNAVTGFTGTLLMQLPGPLNAEQESQLRTVQSSARRLQSLINDLLEVARLDSGDPELHCEQLDCVPVLGEVLATLEPEAARKGLRLESLVMQPAVPADLDRRALSQIMANLVANAVKYTERGAVTVTLEQAGEGSRREVQLRIKDTGRGIAPADQSRLFKSFSRLDRHGYGGEGTGLGLYLTRRLVEAQGGSIACASEPGRGSEFTVRLPAACQP
jgi:protein-histidine pros-kinase